MNRYFQIIQVDKKDTTERHQMKLENIIKTFQLLSVTGGGLNNGLIFFHVNQMVI